MASILWEGELGASNYKSKLDDMDTTEILPHFV